MISYFFFNYIHLILIHCLSTCFCNQSFQKISLSFILKVPRRMKMRILRMTMSHSQIQKKNNFQPEDQISTVYKNSSFQPEHYFLGRGFFILMILFFNQLLRYHIFPARWFSTTYCDQTNIRKGYPYKQFQPLISDTPKIIKIYIYRKYESSLRNWKCPFWAWLKE